MDEPDLQLVPSLRRPSPYLHSRHSTSAMKSQNTPFRKLPLELLKEMSEFIKPADLLAWRLVCKTFNINSIKAFGKAHIETRRHIFTSQSLQVLINVTAHPVWARFVRNIEIGATLVTPTPVSLGLMSSPSSPGCTPEQSWREKYESIVADQADLLDKKGVNLFSKAFVNLNLCTPGGIHLVIYRDVSPVPQQQYEEEPNEFEYFVRASYQTYRDLEGISLMQQLHGHVLHIMLSAAAKVSFLPCGIKLLDYRNPLNRGPRVVLPLRHREWAVSAAVLSNLKQLEIKIGVSFGPLDVEIVPLLGCLIQRAPALESLHLDGLSPHCMDLSQSLSQRAQAQLPLHTLRVDNTTLQGEELISTLDDYKATLRQLTISNVLALHWDHFSDYKSWLSIFKWMLRHLELEGLSLSPLYRRAYNDYEDLDSIMIEVEKEERFNSHEDVNQGLVEIIARLSAADPSSEGGNDNAQGEASTS